jgi:hypothetical protein
LTYLELKFTTMELLSFICWNRTRSHSHLNITSERDMHVYMIIVSLMSTHFHNDAILQRSSNNTTTFLTTTTSTFNQTTTTTITQQTRLLQQIFFNTNLHDHNNETTSRNAQLQLFNKSLFPSLQVYKIFSFPRVSVQNTAYRVFEIRPWVFACCDSPALSPHRIMSMINAGTSCIIFPPPVLRFIPILSSSSPTHPAVQDLCLLPVPRFVLAIH